jgi:hypothetical protein
MHCCVPLETVHGNLVGLRAADLLMCVTISVIHRGAVKSLAQPTSRCISFDGENI